MPDPTPIPQSQVPVTGDNDLATTAWYRFLYDVYSLTGAGQNGVSLTDLQVGPPPLDSAVVAEMVKAIQGVQTGPSDSGLIDQIAELTKTVQGLQEGPPIVPSIDTSTALLALIESTRSLAYNGGAALTGATYTTVPYSTEIFDAGGDFNTSTYQFTVPDTGNYLVTSQVSVSKTNPPAGDILSLEIFKNGSSVFTLDFYTVPVNITGSYAQTVKGSLVIPLVAGDYIEIGIYPTGGSWSIDASGATGIGFFGVTRLS